MDIRKDKAWRKALQAINDWFKANPDYDIDVQFAVLDDNIIQLGNKTAKDLHIPLKAEETPVNKKKAKPDVSDIHAFAIKYRNLYLNPATKEEDLYGSFTEECRSFDFEMDCAKAFSDKYSDSAFYSVEGLLNETSSRSPHPLRVGICLDPQDRRLATQQ